MKKGNAMFLGAVSGLKFIFLLAAGAFLNSPRLIILSGVIILVCMWVECYLSKFMRFTTDLDDEYEEWDD